MDFYDKLVQDIKSFKHLDCEFRLGYEPTTCSALFTHSMYQNKLKGSSHMTVTEEKQCGQFQRQLALRYRK